MAVWNGIYLGTTTVRIDPTEGNNGAENAGALVGQTYGGPGNALAGDITTVETFGINGNNALDQNNNVVNETFTADIGNGTQTFVFDAVVSYNATITYLDGSTTQATVVVFQSTTGELFLAPGLTDPANAPLIAEPIQSITLNSTGTTTALGLAETRPTIPFIACFAAGTLIRTAQGLRPVETIAAGDMVWTRDDGLQPVAWAGGRQVDGRGALAPVRFAAGALGNDRALIVSPQHRMLVTGWQAELFCGEPEVLVAAVHLVNGDTVARVPMARVSYHHIMFDAHQIVAAEGCLTESFLPGAEVARGDAALWDELVTVFPELGQRRAGTGLVAARPVAAGGEGRALAGLLRTRTGAGRGGAASRAGGNLSGMRKRLDDSARVLNVGAG
jgi:Hint domain